MHHYRQLNDTYLNKIGVKQLEGYLDPYHKRPMKMGEIGCFLSHYFIWKEVRIWILLYYFCGISLLWCHYTHSNVNLDSGTISKEMSGVVPSKRPVVLYSWLKMITGIFNSENPKSLFYHVLYYTTHKKVLISTNFR